ncbi:MAG TPA: hypothetical protein VEW07_13445 [Solirubrobacterales bacterium]|nr:hypothetical protein [Solirubrobacterales bacterium]
MRPRSESRPRRRRPRVLTLAGLAALLGLAVLCAGVWAAYSGSSSSAGNELVSAPDWVAPTASASLIGKSQGGVPGYIRQGGTYNVYANVSDSGNPPSGVSSVAGGLGTITTGQSAAALSAGSFAIGGAAYSYRSANLTANATLAAGTYSYSLTSKDVLGAARLQTGFTVIVDNTAPTAVEIQTTNKSGNAVGRPEIGDSVVYTFSERIDPGSILSGWTGTTTSVVTRITNATTDALTVFNAANTTQLPLGSVGLGRNDYVTASATFGSTGTASTMVQSGNTITVTLGTASSGPSTASSTGTMTWSPSASAYDLAGNAQSTATRTETGSADKEF